VTTTPQPDRIDGAAYLRLVGLGAAFAAVRFPAIFLGIGLAMLAVELLDVSPALAVAVGTAAWLRRTAPHRRLNPDPTAG
jgi:hypothetical protein